MTAAAAESIELAAAAIQLTCAAAGEPLPAALRDRLGGQARDLYHWGRPARRADA